MYTIQTPKQLEKMAWLLINNGCHILEDAYTRRDAKLLASLLSLSDFCKVSARLKAKLS